MVHYVLDDVHLFFCFKDTATTEIYTLSLHDALPICRSLGHAPGWNSRPVSGGYRHGAGFADAGAARQGRAKRPERRGGHPPRSEEHTSELQSRQYLVCRLLLEKKRQFTCNRRSLNFD